VLAGVAEVRYVDKEAAAEEFREMFGDGLLDAVSHNPLPASLRVRLSSGGALSDQAVEIREALSGRAEVEAVDAGEQWLSSLDRFSEVSVWVGSVLGGVLCLACAFAVGNTVKLMVLAQQETIVVMRLVGASGNAIRVAFLLGGGLLGLGAGTLAAAGLWFGNTWWSARVPELASVSPQYPILAILALGPVLGVLGSWASLSRVLRAVSWK